MSECVVRMEMPENCECCPMVFTADVQGYHWCAALEQEVEQGLSRPKECPIICQLPEGHGRLVDADKLADDMKARKWFIGRASDPDCLVFDAPTIVPATNTPNKTPTNTPTATERSET